jgi:3-dehydroquinate synthase
MTNQHQVKVELAERRYDILIGRNLVSDIGERARALNIRTAFIVTDTNVGALYRAQVTSSLEKAGTHVSVLTLAAGEATKSFEQLERILDAALDAKIERGDCLIALGGGVIGDLTGFAAAILRRGVRFIQIPTSLLAQVDSSVGGKTGINARHGKNLIGAFHQPSLVIADTALIDTLPVREIKAGYAEIVKYGLINDAHFFNWCEKNVHDIFEGGPTREEAVAYSCRAKAAIVGRDEREDGERALLNLGHTFGHALERLTHYDSSRLVHGEGVAIGLCLAFRFSADLGLCSMDDAQRVSHHLHSVGLPTQLADIPGGCGNADDLLEAMYQDKKVKAGALTFILAKGIGDSFIAENIDPAQVKQFLTHALSH